MWNVGFMCICLVSLSPDSASVQEKESSRQHLAALAIAYLAIHWKVSLPKGQSPSATKSKPHKKLEK